MVKTAVLYVFHEVTDRVRHFVQFCTFESPDVGFYVIENNLLLKFDLPPYIKTMNRTNICYDFGAWSECLVNDDMYKKYEYFIFANSSIVGPFLPKNFNGRWTDIYTNGLKDNVKLFGSTINATGDSRGAQHSPEVAAHIQSYIFSADREAVEYLMECKILCRIRSRGNFNILHQILNIKIKSRRREMYLDITRATALKIRDKVAIKIYEISTCI